MNADALKLSELRETQRANREKERIEANKAGSARMQAVGKLISGIGESAGGVLKLAGRNDSAWETPNREDLCSAARLTSFTRSWGAATPYGPHGMIQTPSILTLNYEPMLGDPTANNAVFKSFKAIYNAIRGKNLGATNYSVGDVMAYFFPPLTMLVEVAKIERAIHAAYLYDVRVSAVGDALLRAMGFEPLSFRRDLALISERLAQLKVSLNLIPVPVTFHALQRWIWLNSFVFVDKKESGVFQMVVVSQEHFHILASDHNVENAPEYMTRLVYGSGHHSVLNQGENSTTILARIIAMDTAIQNLLQNSTYQAISGDIINYFGGNIIQSEDEELRQTEDIIIYDEEFLAELHAMSVFTTGSGGSNEFLDTQFRLGYDTKYGAAQGLFNTSECKTHAPIIGTISGGNLNVNWYAFINGDRVCLPLLDGYEMYSERDVFVASRFMFNIVNDTSGYETKLYVPSPNDDPREVTIPAGQAVSVHNYGTELIIYATYWSDFESEDIEEQGDIFGNAYHLNNGSGLAQDTARWDVGPCLMYERSGLEVAISQADIERFAPDDFIVMPVETLTLIQGSALLALWNTPIKLDESIMSGKPGRSGRYTNDTNRHGSSRRDNNKKPGPSGQQQQQGGLSGQQKDSK